MQPLRDRQHRGVAGRVVVGAGMDGVLVRLHRALTAVAEVIVVRAEDDDFVGERTAAGEDAGDVLAR